MGCQFLLHYVPLKMIKERKPKPASYTVTASRVGLTFGEVKSLPEAGHVGLQIRSKALVLLWALSKLQKHQDWELGTVPSLQGLCTETLLCEIGVSEQEALQQDRPGGEAGKRHPLQPGDLPVSCPCLLSVCV